MCKDNRPENLSRQKLDCPKLQEELKIVENITMVLFIDYKRQIETQVGNYSLIWMMFL